MNLYWPIYKSLESEVIKLSYSIHFDDKQLNMYSIICSNLILRAAAEIESLSKELYLKNGGNSKKNLKYDSDALKFLNKKWKLENKEVLLTSPNFFFTKHELTPFVKNTVSDHHGYLTFLWNNAYQNLKHDRVNKFKSGNVENLIEIMSALYLLNIYKKEEVISFGNDIKGRIFDRRLESDLFSIKIFNPFLNEIYRDGSNAQCTYFVKLTDRTIKENGIIENFAVKQVKKHFKNSIMSIDFAKSNDNTEITDDLIRQLLLDKKFSQLNNHYRKIISEKKIPQILEAVPNKNCI